MRRGCCPPARRDDGRPQTGRRSPTVPHDRGGAMRWRRASRVFGIARIVLAALIYLLVMAWGVPLLWPYRDRPWVRVLLAFLTGGHLEERLQETGTLLSGNPRWSITIWTWGLSSGFCRLSAPLRRQPRLQGTWNRPSSRKGETAHEHSAARLSRALAGDCPGLSDPGGHQPERAWPDRGPANGGAGETRLAVASPLCRGGGAGDDVARLEGRPTEYLSGLHPCRLVGGPAGGALFPPAVVCPHADPHPPLYRLWRVAGPTRGIPRAEPGGGRHLRGGRVSAQQGGHHRCPPRGAGAGGCPGPGVDAAGHRAPPAPGGRPRRRPLWVAAVGADGDDRGRGAPGPPPLEPPVAAP